MKAWIEHCKGRPKILVVDDQRTNICVINELFRFDCDMYMAKSGKEAIKLTQTVLPDLILLDIMMEGMDGFDVCRQLKSDPHTAGIPIIFITARHDEQDEAMGLELGAVDYITKPLNPIIVRARVKTHLTMKIQSDYLKDLASLDGLTGIPNRRAFDLRLSEAWGQACRDSGIVSMILIDIDHFKRYNDHFGHLQGDECLRQVAGAIAQSINRPYDLAARFGGEEFACILPQTNVKGAQQLAMHIQHKIAQLALAHPKSDVSPLVTLSIGIASIQPWIGSDANSLIRQADEQLYHAKETGRARICAGKAAITN